MCANSIECFPPREIALFVCFKVLLFFTWLHKHVSILLALYFRRRLELFLLYTGFQSGNKKLKNWCWVGQSGEIYCVAFLACFGFFAAGSFVLWPQCCFVFVINDMHMFFSHAVQVSYITLFNARTCMPLIVVHFGIFFLLFLKKKDVSQMIETISKTLEKENY